MLSRCIIFNCLSIFIYNNAIYKWVNKLFKCLNIICDHNQVNLVASILDIDSAELILIYRFLPVMIVFSKLRESCSRLGLRIVPVQLNRERGPWRVARFSVPHERLSLTTERPWANARLLTTALSTLLHCRSRALVQALQAWTSLVLPHSDNHHISVLEPHRQVQRNHARIQMSPHQKNAARCSKSRVRRTSSIASRGSCHKGERSWQLIYVPRPDSPTRFFMIERRREGDELCEKFKVLGSTGNVRRIKR